MYFANPTQADKPSGSAQLFYFKTKTMIKFFRHIRKSLLMENPPAEGAGKTSKYIKYAIGEIILVVIGILIALSINNWNENQKQKKQLDAIYTTVEQNLKTDLKQAIRKIQTAGIGPAPLRDIQNRELAAAGITPYRERR